MRGLKGKTTTFTFSTFSPGCRSLFLIKTDQVGTGTSEHSPTSRSARGNRRTLRRAPALHRTDVALSVDNSATYTCRVSHLGSPQLRVCNSHASGLDRDLQTSPSLWEKQQLQLPHHPRIPADGAHLIAGIFVQKRHSGPSLLFGVARNSTSLAILCMLFPRSH